MTFRPALRPGAPLLRRDATNLQVGTSPGVVIADRPGLLALLRLLDGSRDVERLPASPCATIPELTAPVADVLRELRSAGVVFDASRWSAPHRRGLDAEARHADLGGDDPAAARATGRRSGLAFHTDAGSSQLAEITQAVLADAGVTRSSTPTIPTCWSSPRAENPRARCSSDPSGWGSTTCRS